VFTRQFWFIILQSFGLQAVAPQMNDQFFVEWWNGASSRLSGQVKKGFNSIIILGAWSVWKHCNHYIFDGGAPALPWVISEFKEEAQCWSVAGARGVSHLLALAPS